MTGAELRAAIVEWAEKRLTYDAFKHWSDEDLADDLLAHINASALSLDPPPRFRLTTDPPPLEPDDSITTYFTTGLVPPAWLERLWRRVRGHREEPQEPPCAHPGCGKPISDPTHT